MRETDTLSFCCPEEFLEFKVRLVLMYFPCLIIKQVGNRRLISYANTTYYLLMSCRQFHLFFLLASHIAAAETLALKLEKEIIMKWDNSVLPISHLISVVVDAYHVEKKLESSPGVLLHAGKWRGMKRKTSTSISLRRFHQFSSFSTLHRMFCTHSMCWLMYTRYCSRIF